MLYDRRIAEFGKDRSQPPINAHTMLLRWVWVLIAVAFVLSLLR